MHGWKQYLPIYPESSDLLILPFNDDRLVKSWEDDDPDKYDRFWDWSNGIESVNLESDAKTEALRLKYVESVEDKVLAVGCIINAVDYL